MSNIVELTIAAPDGATVTEATQMLEAARAVRVSTPQQSVDLQQTRQRINTRIKALQEERLAMTRPLDAAKKTIVEFFAGPIEALTNAMRTCDVELVNYQTRVEADRQAAQRRADEVAARERERLQAIADRAAAKGQESKAEKFAERAVTTVAQVVVPDLAKAAGVSFRKNWTFTVIDPTRVSPEFRSPDEVKIGRVVRSMGRDAQPLVGDGVKIFEATSVASRSV